MPLRTCRLFDDQLLYIAEIYRFDEERADLKKTGIRRPTVNKILSQLTKHEDSTRLITVMSHKIVSGSVILWGE